MAQLIATARRRLVASSACGLLALSGCGTEVEPQIASAGGTPSASPTVDVVTAYVEAVRGYVACMRTAGVQVSDPDAKGRFKLQSGGTNLKADRKFLAASEKCKELLPPVPAGLIERPVLSAAEIEIKQKYATCMRTNGATDFPDPGPDGYYPERADGQPTWNQEAPAAIRAARACASIVGGSSDPGAGVG